jgi:peptidoglycan/LPS O-acetylase OafA/YrhL
LSQHAHLKYRADVDGLRAVAILPVIFYHAGVGFSGGYVGVDIFFVISGYLISGLILKDLNHDRFHITEFWERRVRRIVPALAVVVLATFVAGWFLFFPQDLKELGQSMLAQAVLASNFYFYADAGYFTQGVDLKPLIHTWSLAVEEQFYLFFPFFLIGVRRFSRKSIIPAILAVGAVSLLLSVYCSYAHSRANFYLLPTRAWELLTGSLLAAIPARQVSVRWLAEFLSVCGLAAILCALFLFDSETRFPGAAALLPCVGAALIIWSNDHTLTLAGKCLASRPMVFIGMISYSLYLWHWPVLVFFKYATLSPIPMVWRFVLLLASVALATVSWKYVETPFRKRVVLKQRSQVFLFGGVTTALIMLTGLGVYRWQGLPSRIPVAALKYLEGTAAGDAASPVSERILTLADAQKGDFHELGNGDKKQPISLLLWGDSHAQVILPAVDSLCQEHSWRGVAATHSQTAPLIGYDSEGVWSLKSDSIPFNNAVVDFIHSRHIPNVLIIARWDYYIETDKGTGKLRAGLLATIEALQRSGARIWIMRQVPRYPWNVPKALATAVLHGHNPEELGLPLAEYRTESQSQDSLFDGLAKDFPGVTVLDPADRFVSASGRCKVAQNGKALYYDSDHVNVLGAMMLRPLFEPIFGSADKGGRLAWDKSGER